MTNDFTPDKVKERINKFIEKALENVTENDDIFYMLRCGDTNLINEALDTYKNDAKIIKKSHLVNIGSSKTIRYHKMTTYYCSNCNQHDVFGNYCFNCGSKFDKENKND